ncbi:MAG: hypothetical protein K2G69_03050 [Muribaculaceae bacterium]|nr:hypothetical protein [Muribaculaceae bacterium]
MTKSEFLDLKTRAASSGKPLKVFLQGEGIAYTTYNYWWRKMKREAETLPIAPISIRSNPQEKITVGVPGVMVAFPNGVRAHFGQGSDSVLMELLTKSMGHVLP